MRRPFFGLKISLSESSTPLLDPLTRQVIMMAEFDVGKIVNGLAGSWPGFLRDWDRHLRAGNRPATTRYNYLLAAAQLGRFLRQASPDPDAPAAAQCPSEVRRAHREATPQQGLTEAQRPLVTWPHHGHGGAAGAGGGRHFPVRRSSTILTSFP